MISVKMTFCGTSLGLVSSALAVFLLAAGAPSEGLADDMSCNDPYREYYLRGTQENTWVRLSWWEDYSPYDLEEHPFSEERRRILRESGCGVEVVYDFTLSQIGLVDEVQPSCQDSWNANEYDTLEFTVFDKSCVPDGEITYTLQVHLGVDEDGNDEWYTKDYPRDMCIRGNANECGVCGNGVNGECSSSSVSGCSFPPGRPEVPLFSFMAAVGLTVLFLSRRRDGN